MSKFFLPSIIVLQDQTMASKEITPSMECVPGQPRCTVSVFFRAKVVPISIDDW